MDSNEIDLKEQNSVEEDAVDLRGSISLDAPQEKKYKPLLFASIFTIPILLIMIFVGKLFHAFVMEYSTHALLHDVGRSIGYRPS